MKKTYISLTASALLASLTFVGCGSSSDSTTTAPTTPQATGSSSGTLSLNPNLANVDYDCGQGSKVTSASGEFNYNDGDECTFTIGGKDLKITPSSNKITIAKLAAANTGVDFDALQAYVLAGTNTSDVNSLPDNVEITDTYKTQTKSITDFSSIENFQKKMLESSDIDADLKKKMEKNISAVDFSNSIKYANKIDIKFKEIPTPTTNETKTVQQASSEAMVNGKKQDIGFTTIMSTGYADNSEVFGLSKDYTDTPITFTDGSNYICNGTNDGVGSGLDYTSFLNKNGKIYMVSQFECQVGSYYMAELEQNTTTGALTPKANSLKFISQKDEFGGFVHCAGQKTPWESHLGSEEYEPNARSVEAGADATTGLTGNKYYDEVAKYWKGDAKKMSPYYYGWTPEVTVDNAGNPTYAKHYSMGRMSHELSYVMPDNKTVYLSDDGTNVGLFMYVADTANDLSAGTLYAAKWNQTSEVGVGSGEADITWVNLGHATDAEIRTHLDPDNDVTTNDAKVFSDIFETASGNEDGTCPTGFKAVNTSAYFECLKLKPGMEKVASRLETRRYASYMGATTEFRKEEGITFDENSGKLYVAMSAVERGMEDNKKSGSDNTKYDLGGNNDIKVEYNKCGAVYALDVNKETAKDTTDTNISSSFVVKNMKAVISGNPKSYADDSKYANNSCDVNAISNPDNVTFLKGSNILMIGEDTSKHENNVVWAYDVKTSELTRTFTTPLDAETTSPFWYNDLKDGFGYLSVVTQHPMEDQEGATALQKESSIGYVGPFKNLNTISSIEKVATYTTSKEAGTEIVAFDSGTNKMYTTNGADNTLDITTVSHSTGTTSISAPTAIALNTYGDSVNSVAVSNGKVAVAMAKDAVGGIQQKGVVVLFDLDGNHIQTVNAGYLPDMVTFNEDGSLIIVANEGEPNADYSHDPKGSIGIIDSATYSYTDLTFDGVTIPSNVVLKAGTPASLDLEPEYVTVQGTKAYVTLQENNAIAIVDLSAKTIESVVALGFKDHSKEENSIDIEEEGEIKLKAYKGLKGMYQPDSIASYTLNDKTYLVTANEGDGREYGSYENESKISKLSLDSSIASEYAEENDLKVNNELGKVGSAYTELYAFGARSFSIWDDAGTLVFDSKNELAKLTAKYEETLFNQDDGEKDKRSGNKGVEPEALTVGEVNGKTYAFVGLERQSVIVVYDITEPTKARFVKYIDTKSADISPEGMKFVKASNSPTGNALLLVAFEVSGSTSIFEIK